jgi:hypothetical protein
MLVASGLLPRDNETHIIVSVYNVHDVAIGI